MMLSSAYFVVAPIVYKPEIQYIYAMGFFLVGIIVYIPFVYFNLSLPGTGKS